MKYRSCCDMNKGGAAFEKGTMRRKENHILRMRDHRTPSTILPLGRRKRNGYPGTGIFEALKVNEK